MYSRMLRSSFLFTLFLSVAVSHAQVIDRKNYTIQKQTSSSKGAVVSAHPLASMVGLSILKTGGNAFDAAIATQLALAVVYPGAGNIGGGGFLVAHTKQGKNISLDSAKKPPAKQAAICTSTQRAMHNCSYPKKDSWLRVYPARLQACLQP
jgi:gamma-glutamyltranspeptidase / glutathione hydrolase